MSKEILGELHELIRNVEVISPEVAESSDRLRRFGPMSFGPRDLREADEVRRLVGLAERVRPAAPQRSDIASLEKQLEKIGSVNLSPDDIIATLLHKLAPVPLPQRLRSVLESVKVGTEFSIQPYT